MEVALQLLSGLVGPPFGGLVESVDEVVADEGLGAVEGSAEEGFEVFNF